MDIVWTPPTVAAAVLVALWLIALATQLADIGTARFDARRLARGTRPSVRLHSVAWTVPLAALAVVGTGVGADIAARQVLSGASPLSAALTALATVVVLVAGWLVVVAAVTRVPTDSYRGIRDELVDLHGVRVHQDVLDQLRARIEAIEATGARRQPPVDESLGSALRWVIRRPQRLAPPLLALAMTIALPAAGAPAWLTWIGTGAVLLSAALAVVGARTSLHLLSAVRATQLDYRAEALHLLADAEKISRKRVQGLGDRVTRALQILREQQD